jgi:hypothetical protein
VNAAEAARALVLLLLVETVAMRAIRSVYIWHTETKRQKFAPV